MADIFISYSSKDKEKADQLSELLASAGLSVWIDQAGLEVSNSWSKEIVAAINDCKAFVVLLSPNSLESHNVIKEVSLASEKRKKILPLELEPITLTDDFEYQLAGIHRTPMTNIDSIIRALGKLGLEATQAPTLKLVKESDSRKSLMILPFEDFSPTADNEWFANGIVSELINALTNVKALRVMDAQTTKEFKTYKGHLTVYAKEMGVRYFVQGDVRKFGDTIKISSRLLDIESGDHLWQDSMKGTMDDIFDIQEKVAEKVVEGLNIILTDEEAKKVAKKPTENAEAYELYLKGNEYYRRQTRADFERALSLYEEAARIDPKFAQALVFAANTTLAYYRNYSPDLALLTKAREQIKQAESVLGESKEIFWTRSILSRNEGNYEEALHLAKRSAELDPEFAVAYDAQAFAYQALGRKVEAAEASKRHVQLRENDWDAHFGYLLTLHELNDVSVLREASSLAIPHYERHLRLAPDDLNGRVQYATILNWAGDHDRAIGEAERLEASEVMDGGTLYNLACLFLNEGDAEGGMRLFRKSVDCGYRNLELFHRDPDLAPLRGTAEFEALMKELEAGNG